MTRPRQFLGDVYEQLGPDQQAALALVYAAAARQQPGKPAQPGRGTARHHRPSRQHTRPGRRGALSSHRRLSSGHGPAVRQGRVGLPPPDPLGRIRLLGRYSDPPAHRRSLTASQTLLLLRRVDCEDENADEKTAPFFASRHRFTGRGRTASHDPAGPFIGEKWTEKGRPPAHTDAYQRTPAQEVGRPLVPQTDPATRSCASTWTVDPGLPGNMMLSSPPTVSPWCASPVCSTGSIESDCSAKRVRLRAVDEMAELAIVTPDSGWLYR